jgi:cytoskeleton protein RodZ
VNATAREEGFEPELGLEPPTGPGRRLQAAREQAGLSVNDIAGRLRLDLRTVTALEADRYEQLPGPAFVRGYLRGYARILNLAPEPILEAFDRQGLAPPALIADISERPQARSSDFPVRVTTWLIITGLVVLVVLWWRSQHLDPIPHPDEIAAAPAVPSTPPTSVVELLPAPGAETPVEVPTPPMAPPAREPLADGIAPPPPGLPAPATEPGTPLAATPDPPAAGEMTPTPTPAPPSPSPSPAGPSAEVEATPDPMPREDHLRLTISEESWVEVYDRDGDRLFYNLARPGAELDLRGQGPMRVLLGKADGVRVEYNGAPFDYSRHVDRGIARFTLGER